MGCTADAIISRAMGWFERQAGKEAKKDDLKRSDRFGQIVGIIAVIIVIVFFAYHLTKPTGFFTPAFGPSTRSFSSGSISSGSFRRPYAF